MAPGLACLDRARGSIQAFGDQQSEPGDTSQAKAILSSLIASLDSIDRSGCSAETNANLARTRDAAANLLAIMNNIGPLGPTRQQMNDADAFTLSMVTAGDAITAEHNRRRQEYEQRLN